MAVWPIPSLHHLSLPPWPTALLQVRRRRSVSGLAICCLRLRTTRALCPRARSRRPTGKRTTSRRTGRSHHAPPSPRTTPPPPTKISPRIPAPISPPSPRTRNPTTTTPSSPHRQPHPIPTDPTTHDCNEAQGHIVTPPPRPLRRHPALPCRHLTLPRCHSNPPPSPYASGADRELSRVLPPSRRPPRLVQGVRRRRAPKASRSRHVHGLRHRPAHQGRHRARPWAVASLPRSTGAPFHCDDRMARTHVTACEGM